MTRGRPRRGESGGGARRPGSPGGFGGRAGRPRPPSGRGTGRTGGRQPSRGHGLGGEQVEGRQAVRELLAAGRRRVREVWVAEGLEPSPLLDDIERLATRRRTRVLLVGRRRLESVARTDAAQGVLARAAPLEETPLAELCERRGGDDPFLLVLDGIGDPQNLGALLRSAECAGMTGVVLPRHRAAHITPTVAKVAAGAIEHLPMAVVPGVPSALAHLAGRDVVTIGLDARAGQSVFELGAEAEGPVALVLGAEGKGVAPLARRRCQVLVAIPQHGALDSLNVAAAGAVACFELLRRRLAAKGDSPRR